VGGGLGAESYDCKKAWASINLSIFCKKTGGRVAPSLQSVTTGGQHSQQSVTTGGQHSQCRVYTTGGRVAQSLQSVTTDGQHSQQSVTTGEQHSHVECNR
jgi:hypothetical protein